jgi:hypothetical protein
MIVSTRKEQPFSSTASVGDDQCVFVVLDDDRIIRRPENAIRRRVIENVTESVFARPEHHEVKRLLEDKMADGVRTLVNRTEGDALLARARAPPLDGLLSPIPNTAVPATARGHLIRTPRVCTISSANASRRVRPCAVKVPALQYASQSVARA